MMASMSRQTKGDIEGKATTKWLLANKITRFRAARGLCGWAGGCAAWGSESRQCARMGKVSLGQWEGGI